MEHNRNPHDRLFDDNLYNGSIPDWAKTWMRNFRNSNPSRGRTRAINNNQYFTVPIQQQIDIVQSNRNPFEQLQCQDQIQIHETQSLLGPVHDSGVEALVSSSNDDDPEQHSDISQLEIRHTSDHSELTVTGNSNLSSSDNQQQLQDQVEVPSDMSQQRSNTSASSDNSDSLSLTSLPDYNVPNSETRLLGIQNPFYDNHNVNRNSNTDSTSTSSSNNSRSANITTTNVNDQDQSGPASSLGSRIFHRRYREIQCCPQTLSWVVQQYNFIAMRYRNFRRRLSQSIYCNNYFTNQCHDQYSRHCVQPITRGIRLLRNFEQDPTKYLTISEISLCVTIMIILPMIILVGLLDSSPNSMSKRHRPPYMEFKGRPGNRNIESDPLDDLAAKHKGVQKKEETNLKKSVETIAKNGGLEGETKKLVTGETVSSTTTIHDALVAQNSQNSESRKTLKDWRNHQDYNKNTNPYGDINGCNDCCNKTSSKQRFCLCLCLSLGSIGHLVAIPVGVVTIGICTSFGNFLCLTLIVYMILNNYCCWRFSIRMKQLVLCYWRFSLMFFFLTICLVGFLTPGAGLACIIGGLAGYIRYFTTCCGPTVDPAPAIFGAIEDQILTEQELTDPNRVCVGDNACC